jgi:hypothetical protein
MKQSMTCSKEHLLSRHNILCMFLYCRCNHTQPPPTGKENMSPMKTRKLYVAQLPSVYCSVCTPSTLGGKVMKGNIMISLLTTKAEEAEERILGPDLFCRDLFCRDLFGPTFFFCPSLFCPDLVRPRVVEAPLRSLMTVYQPSEEEASLSESESESITGFPLALLLSCSSLFGSD